MIENSRLALRPADTLFLPIEPFSEADTLLFSCSVSMGRVVPI